MIAPEPPSEVNVQLERTPSIPIAPSEKQAPASLPYRSIDPSQTLQLPFHESQKAETPFINPLGEPMNIATPTPARTFSHPKQPSSKRSSPNLAEATAKPRCVPEAEDEKATWQDGWVQIVHLEQGLEKENFGPVKKRSKKEWRNEEVEPVKKKAKDHNRSLWAKKPRDEKVGTSWMPEIGSIRRVCT